MQICLDVTVHLDSLGHIVSTPVVVSEVLDVQCLCVGVGMLYIYVYTFAVLFIWCFVIVCIN